MCAQLSAAHLILLFHRFLTLSFCTWFALPPKTHCVGARNTPQRFRDPCLPLPCRSISNVNTLSPAPRIDFLPECLPLRESADLVHPGIQTLIPKRINR